MRTSHVFLIAAAFAVCASAKAADRRDAELEMSQALTAVQTAEREDGARYAPADLNEAHTMLDNAQRAFDLRDWTGTAIYAAGDGVVVRAGRVSGYGNYVEIDHNQQYATDAWARAIHWLNA